MKKSYAKQKLMSAAAMLAVSVMMLSSASFAWFSVSTAPTVKGITTNVKANENLEIALGNGSTTAPNESALGDAQTGDTTWGGTVTFVDNDFTGTNMGPAAINNTNKTLAAATYDNTGRPNTNLTDVTVNDISNGKKVGTATDAEGNIVATYMDFWLRTNKAGDISLTIGEITGADALKDSDSNSLVRIAVQVLNESGGITSITEVTPGVKSTILSVTAGDGGNVNKAQHVRVYMYLDGTKTFNKHMGADVTGIKIAELKFENSTIDGSKSYTNAANIPAAPSN